MQRSAVAADILTALEACFGPRCGEYVFARTRGLPPADCNSITASWSDRSVDQLTDCYPLQGCGQWSAEYAMRIVVTNICIGPDAQQAFDWRNEDAAAACFDADVEIVESCIQCTDWSQLGIDHSISSVTYLSTSYDVESEGGGFSAYIDVRIVAEECCP